jgi:hypothetical protein
MKCKTCGKEITNVFIGEGDNSATILRLEENGQDFKEVYHVGCYPDDVCTADVPVTFEGEPFCAMCGESLPVDQYEMIIEHTNGSVTRTQTYNEDHFTNFGEIGVSYRCLPHCAFERGTG